MQVKTLTITTEQIEAGKGELFRLTSFEMKIEAFCDICGRSASGTENALKGTGWQLGRNEQFCPDCN